MTRKRGPYKFHPPEGTVSALIRAFRSSPRYLGWSPLTRAQNDHKLAAFDKHNGDRIVSELRRGDFLRLRDSLADTPGAARNWMQVINAIMDYAVDLEWIEVNPAKSIPRLSLKDADGHRTWREDEIETYLAYHQSGNAHTAMVLMLYTAASVADAVLLGPGNIKGGDDVKGDGVRARDDVRGGFGVRDPVDRPIGRIVYRRKKTAKRAGPVIDIPILPPLAEMLSALPPRMTFLETRDGRVRSPQTLTLAMAQWVTTAGLGAPDEAGRHLTCHGLRKAMARRLAEAGVPPQSIMAWLGHRSITQAAHYSAAYDRARAADQAAELMGGAVPSNVTRMRKGKE